MISEFFLINLYRSLYIEIIQIKLIRPKGNPVLSYSTAKIGHAILPGDVDGELYVGVMAAAALECLRDRMGSVEGVLYHNFAQTRYTRLLFRRPNEFKTCHQGSVSGIKNKSVICSSMIILHV